jgi:hypothetical protein
MAPPPTPPPSGARLLELLHYAGWQIEGAHGPPARIRAARDGVEVEAVGASLAEAVTAVFGRAMRARRRRRR